jgi:cation transport ATPase
VKTTNTITTADRPSADRGGHSVAMFRNKFWISFALTIPILLPPAVAAVLMSANTVIVAINAQLLRLHRL